MLARMVGSRPEPACGAGVEAVDALGPAYPQGKGGELGRASSASAATGDSRSGTFRAPPGRGATRRASLLRYGRSDRPCGRLGIELGAAGAGAEPDRAARGSSRSRCGGSRSRQRTRCAPVQRAGKLPASYAAGVGERRLPRARGEARRARACRHERLARSCRPLAAGDRYAARAGSAAGSHGPVGGPGGAGERRARCRGASVAVLASTRSYAAGARNLLLWGAHADALVFAVNRGLWDMLSRCRPRAAAAGSARCGRTAGAMARRQSDDASLAELARDGVVVTRLTAAGKLPFRNQTRAVYDKWTAVVGEDLVRAAEAGRRPRDSGVPRRQFT